MNNTKNTNYDITTDGKHFHRTQRTTKELCYLRNEFSFWNDHGILNTSGLLQSLTLTLQETLSIHDSMNIPKSDFIAYIYILL